MLKLVAISDTHNHGYDLKNLPAADVLVHAGDACLRGTNEELIRHANWLEAASHKYRYVVYVPGNHDKVFNGPGFDDDARAICARADNIHVLINEHLLIPDTQTGSELVLYGSPVTPPVGWPWYYYYNAATREAFWDNRADVDIKNNYKPDVLVTHGPPYRIADKVAPQFAPNGRWPYVGCKSLRTYVERVEPKVHIFGHIHEQHGVYEGRALGIKNEHDKLLDTVFVNASHRDEDYNKGQNPWLITMDKLPGEDEWSVVATDRC